MHEEAAAPPGWSYNPSGASHRLWLIGLSLLGFVIASYLALVQLGVVRAAWDPLFGSASSGAVLHSGLSRALPVPDAALGALAYLADAVAAMIGGAQRWRTRPWAVLLNGLIAASLCAAGVALAMLQAVVLHRWCALCVTSAVLSTLIAGRSADEVLAALQQHARTREVAS